MDVEKENLEEMFIEMFGGWKDRIERMERKTSDELYVTMKDGRVYRFGTKPSREVFLETVSPQK